MSFLKKMFGPAKHSGSDQTASYDASALYAPAAGNLIEACELPDPVFAQQLMGPTKVIMPSSGEIFSPAVGRLTMIYPTGHAFGIQTDDGAEILVHIGIDTVSLDGKGFHVCGRQGQKVSPKDLIVQVDWKEIEKAGLNPAVMVILTSQDGSSLQDVIKAGTAVSAQDKIALRTK